MTVKSLRERIAAGSLLSLLTGILIGALFVALIAAGTVGLNALTFLWVLILLIYAVKLAHGVDVLHVIGLLIGGLPVILLPTLSPGNVMDAGLLALALFVLTVR